MKKIFAALMIAAAIAAFVLPKAQTYATESADDYVAVQMESDCENFTFSGFSVIPNDNASKYALFVVILHTGQHGMHTAIVIAIADLRVRGIQDIVNSGIRQIPDRNAAGGNRDLTVIHIDQ